VLAALNTSQALVRAGSFSIDRRGSLTRSMVDENRAVSDVSGPPDDKQSFPRCASYGDPGGIGLAWQGAGSSRDFVWGFIMGFCLGFIMLLWLWQIPMSHKQKMGILTGVSCQLGWNILRRQNWSGGA
jgi:hypothetical protein